ncbi:betaine aldehyde dehydrogenase [Palleronia marisminoris]|uniref:Betaine-aldehyde dehydrogenase n=1 Tax=Palleronia marisminoris TaxID=315423 RepID=A0A1Y5SXG7_9RHOB|nr:betaine-aldehyde dehydrogenase [Palleronia marisminoris]SFG96303.1 betaine aldehyde dehydrogenase [Palleronia marisminoris]SLN47347.1 NAD/NADP-dependent betaine aldehyde dehydrogenase [Palleronia marisminoris]
MTDVKPTASHYVDGAYLDDADGQPFDVIYPATGETLATVHAATKAVTDAALDAATRAQAEWAALSPRSRGRVLTDAARIMRERNRELSIIETHDTGKPLQETLVADATSGADALEYFGGIANGLTGEHIQLGDDWAYTIREPLGVCVGIGAWNYPTQIACWKAAPALACGNAMVFKPSENTPLAALKVAEILTEAGAPPGLFNVVQGMGEVGGRLITDPRVAKVSLTGSVGTGKKVYSAAAAEMKHVTMELGGKSPMLVFDDADIENAVSGAILGNFYSSGQVCSNGTRVFVHRSVKEQFLDRLAKRLATAKLGDPLDEETNFGPIVSQQQLDIILGYVARGKEDGARLVTGGARLDKPGFWMSPAIFADVTDDMTIAREEIFGPVMSVLDFNDEDEAIRRANDTPYGLSAGVYTQNLARAHRVIRKLHAGSCFINSYNDAPVEVPFGAVKQSGVGRENAKAAIEHYSQLKSVYVRMGDTEAPF